MSAVASKKSIFLSILALSSEKIIAETDLRKVILLIAACEFSVFVLAFFCRVCVTLSALTVLSIRGYVVEVPSACF